MKTSAPPSRPTAIVQPEPSLVVIATPAPLHGVGPQNILPQSWNSSIAGSGGAFGSRGLVNEQALLVSNIENQFEQSVLVPQVRFRVFIQLTGVAGIGQDVSTMNALNALATARGTTNADLFAAAIADHLTNRYQTSSYDLIATNSPDGGQSTADVPQVVARITFTAFIRTNTPQNFDPEIINLTTIGNNQRQLLAVATPQPLVGNAKSTSLPIAATAKATTTAISDVKTAASSSLSVGASAVAADSNIRRGAFATSSFTA